LLFNREGSNLHGVSCEFINTIKSDNNKHWISTVINCNDINQLCATLRTAKLIVYSMIEKTKNKKQKTKNKKQIPYLTKAKVL
jgi:hypothetical protein